MSRPDIDVPPVLRSGLALAAIVALAIGAVFGLLHLWHEPPGGAPSGAASLVPALQALGPTLQSAPQLDAAASPATASSQARP
jgi:hypothetical protein